MSRSISKFMRGCVLSAVLTASAAIASVAAAQEVKPVVVVAVNKLDDILSDVATMTELAGQGDTGRFVVGVAGLYTNGLDRTRPAGAYVTLGDGGAPKVIGFIPVKNLKGLLATFREQIGPPKESANGVIEIGADRRQSVFIKEQGGWAFISQDPSQLVGLPENPAAILGGLEQQYDLAVRVNMQNIPEPLRELAISQLKLATDQAMQQQSRQLGAEERQIAEQVTKGLLQGIVEFVEQSDQLTLGFAIDGKEKSTFLEATVTAKPNTDLAKQLERIAASPTRFGGLQSSDAAVAFTSSTPLSGSDVQQLRTLIKVGRENGAKEIANSAEIPTQKLREGVLESFNSLLDIADATVSKGQLDLGAAVFAHTEGLELAAAAMVADGVKLEKTVKKIYSLIKEQHAEIPAIKFDFASYGGVNFHKVEIPLDGIDEDARKVFGDNVDLVLGFGKESALIGVGDDAVAVLKKVIDKSSASNAPKLPPMQLKVALSPIFKFAAKVNANDPQARLLASAAEKSQGNDHILVTLKPIQRGVAERIEIGAGIFQIGGEVAKAAQGR